MAFWNVPQLTSVSTPLQIATGQCLADSHKVVFIHPASLLLLVLFSLIRGIIMLALNPQTHVILWPDSLEWNYRLSTTPTLCSLHLTCSPLLSTTGLFLWGQAFWELYPRHLSRICVLLPCTQLPFPFQPELILEGAQSQGCNEG